MKLKVHRGQTFPDIDYWVNVLDEDLMIGKWTVKPKDGFENKVMSIIFQLKYANRTNEQKYIQHYTP